MNGITRVDTGFMSMADIIDGTSNTLAVSEIIIGFPRSGVNSTVQTQAEADGVTNQSNGCTNAGILTGAAAGGRGISWFRGVEPAHLGFTSVMSPNSNLWDCGLNSDRAMMGARSVHPGGVQATLVDGSVKFFSETIDLNTWRFLGGAKDGVPVTFE